MLIAVPTDDGVTIASHFGRCASFLIFNVEDHRIQSLAVRPNTGQHTHQPGGCHAGAAAGGGHNHRNIVASLNGCEVVICAGMGGRAAEALAANGVTPIVAAEPGRAEDAVNAYLAGTLTRSATGLCRCSH